MLIKNIANPMFPRIFTPGCIGKVWLKNRLIKAASLTGTGTRDGCVTQRTVEHYRELARGGVGLVIVEYTYVDNDASKSANCQLGSSSNEHKPGLAWLASTIQANGAKACLQLEHCGHTKFMGIRPIKAPSRVPSEEWHKLGYPVPEELTFEEIVQIAKDFGDAAFRAKQSDFDMVEIHGAHGYLIANFLSPKYNKRTDWYGGDLKNRMRFLLEVVDSVRKKAGPDFPVSVRLSASDYQAGGITIEDSKEVAKALEKAGVSIIHVSGGDHLTGDKEHAPMYWPPGNNIWAAEAIKQVVGIPVIASGSITTPQLAEETLAAGKADFISMARPLLADPYFPQKAREGRPEDIRPCIRCLDGCLHRGITQTAAVQCSVNVAVAREAEFRITPAAKLKNIAVIGGGPAGMEAAIVAAQRGHHVTLYEQRQLGGRLIEASTPDFKADLRSLISYQSTQLKKLGVAVINKEATVRTIKSGGFDSVIVANGALPRIPDVPGLNKPLVCGVLDVFQKDQTGKSVIMVGGGLAGCDGALFLAEKGKKVTIIEMFDQIGMHMNWSENRAYFEIIAKYDVDMKTGVRLEEILDDGVIIRDNFERKSQIDGDTVVIATGFGANTKLFDELAKVPDLEVFAVGDCVQPRKVFDAIHEGHWAAFGLI